MFDAIRIAVGILPIAAYFVVMGGLRLRKRPTVISRALDFLLVGLACLGLVAIGPIELFFPRAAFSVVGNWVWLVLLCLYMLVVLLIAFHFPPGIVVYGSQKERLRFHIEQILAERNAPFDWLGDVLRVESLGIQAQLDEGSGNGVCLIQAVGKKQNLVSWIELDRELHVRFRDEQSVGRQAGVTLMTLGMIAWLAAIGLLILDMDRLNDTIAFLFDS
jgi:hypothetical protein